MTHEEYEEKVRKMVNDYCAPGIEKFKEAETLQFIFNGLIEDAKKQYQVGNVGAADFFANGAKAFRNAALSIFMAHPDYNEMQVLAMLAPSKEIKSMCEQISEIE